MSHQPLINQRVSQSVGRLLSVCPREFGIHYEIDHCLGPSAGVFLGSSVIFQGERERVRSLESEKCRHGLLEDDVF